MRLYERDLIKYSIELQAKKLKEKKLKDRRDKRRTKVSKRYDN